ncbi:MAG: septum formation initiator family protein [Verrucomicrobiales bacterium]
MIRDPEVLIDHDQQHDAVFLYDENPRRPADVWRILNRIMVGLLFVLALAVIVRFFWPEVERQRGLNVELTRLELIKQQKATKVAGLRREQEWLKGDREYLESVARDRLDMGRKGETVIRIERPEETAKP